MTHHEIVKKLIGPICPVGETNTDDKRLENLNQMITLTNLLIGDILVLASDFQGRSEYSIKRARELACDFAKDLQGE